ncbi:MAG: serine/threonine protein kinase [Deltaproteobacteria bacterium]|nr:serine/threonine protein kinase [Deltaproteobacteria bacterium]
MRDRRPPPSIPRPPRQEAASSGAHPAAAVKRPPDETWDIDVDAATSVEVRPDAAKTTIEVRPVEARPIVAVGTPSPAEPRADVRTTDRLGAPIVPRAPRMPVDLAAPTNPPPMDAQPEAPPNETQRRSVPPLYLPAICTYGRYDLLGRLALGGMAEIFLAREDAEGGATRYLVIKRILPHVADDEGFIEMFLQEARVAMRLNHPNICHIYEFGQEEGTYFIAMEWVNGVPLGKLIRRARQEGGIPVPFAMKVIAQVAEALHHAHTSKDASGRSQGIVHRDVTPHNVMVSYDGVVKLLDFGIAKAMDFVTKTQAGVVKGKFAYMAPQQCRGEVIDGRADIFSLGVCLYEVLTGEPLFHRATQFETMRAVIEEEPPSIMAKRPDCPPQLEAIVRRALAKNPDDRFPTAAAMQDALEQVIADGRHVINASRMGLVMHQWYADEIARGPLVDQSPFGSSFRRVAAKLPGMDGASEPPPDAAAAGALPDPAGAPQAVLTTGRVARASRSRGIAWWIGAAVLALGVASVLGVAIFLLFGRATDAAELATTNGLVPSAVGATRTAPPPTPPTPHAASTTGTPAAATGAAAGTTTGASGTVAEPAADAFGSVALRSQPSGATVRIGDRTVSGTTPIEVTDLRPGRYLVTFTRSNHEPWRGEIEVRPGQRSTVEATLAAIARAPVRDREPVEEGPPGTLSINTRPWSRVFLRNRLLGTTPIGGARVPAGSHRLRLVDRDGNTHNRSVRIPPGGNVRLFFDLTQSQ